MIQQIYLLKNFILIFDFLNTEKHEDGLIEALGGLLPEAKGEDYEEQDFANKMKKKRKRPYR